MILLIDTNISDNPNVRLLSSSLKCSLIKLIFKLMKLSTGPSTPIYNPDSISLRQPSFHIKDF
jgi:hypothetical protein